MSETKSNRVVRRGRIFPEIQWSEEKKAQWQAESKAFRQRCEVIFKRVQPELIKTHYNWYIAVEPESGDYFIDRDELEAIKMSRNKHPNAPVFIFRANDTGVAGTI
jgi:hypothetical protein